MHFVIQYSTFLCVYTYIYIYIYTHAYRCNYVTICTYIYIIIWIGIWICVYIYIYIYIRICVYIYIYIYIYVHTLSLMVNRIPEVAAFVEETEFLSLGCYCGIQGLIPVFKLDTSFKLFRDLLYYSNSGTYSHHSV